MKSKALIFLGVYTFLNIGCENTGNKTEQTSTPMTIQDNHSYAQPGEAVIEHLIWNANVDFTNKQISATARFKITTSSDAKKIILDTKGLNIKQVSDGAEQPLEYSLGAEQAFLGTPLEIKISPSTEVISIDYETSDGADALQWLTPAQTAGKVHPFLFTQSQAILARTWIPIQDSPGIRFTYEAEVSVPSGLMALMSAENPMKKTEDGRYTFRMDQKIPAYLMALAVGDVQFAEIGARTGVYAEPSVLESAAYEFAEMEDMLVAAEALYGPYQWGRYDLIVLPPSFPFGGMENPRLTFATPTILAGDRSLTSLVAHELAHSWSGNLVTNATWDDFWLNEGFTVYFEQRIMEALYGRDYSEMLAALSMQDLQREMSQMIAEGKATDTHLKLDLKGRNPDDGMTSIAYDKGYYFLRMLEESVGRDLFDSFLKQYFTSNAFSVMTTEAFVEYMQKHLIEANKLDLSAEMYNSWIYAHGLPENRPTPESNKFAMVEEALESWTDQQDKSQILGEYGGSSWSSHEWLHFVRNLPEGLNGGDMEALDEAFQFTKSGNSEVLTAWLIHVIKNKYDKGYSRLEDFLINTGRRKFLMPLYTELVQTQDGKSMAERIYEKARPNYHYVSVSSIDVLLGIQ